MALQMVQHKTGETFVVDPETMTTTAPLYHSELDAPLGNYQLDHDMDSYDPEDWRVLRYGFEPPLEQQAAQHEWFEANPECEEPTSDKTDEAIRKVLLARNIRMGGDWASVSAEEFREAVEAGMDAWFADIYGTVEHEGKTLVITQLPYADGTTDFLVYRAKAINDDNEYEVTWPVTNSDSWDESDACNWEKYSVRLIGARL